MYVRLVDLVPEQAGTIHISHQTIRALVNERPYSHPLVNGIVALDQSRLRPLLTSRRCMFEYDYNEYSTCLKPVLTVLKPMNMKPFRRCLND